MMAMLLEYFKAKRILDKYGIRSVESSYVESPEEAVAFAGNNQITLKVLSEKELHKSKAGLVRLGLSGTKDIRSAYVALKAKAATMKLSPYKIIAQKMSPSGIEAIIGGREDPQFGKLVLMGLGGIYVETFKDFSLMACPISRYEAGRMLSQLKSAGILSYQGKSSAMIERLLMDVSRLLHDHPEIKELDLNPVILRERDYEIVDIRVLE